MNVYFIIAFRNLVQARRRTLLLSLALGTVTALLVMLLALSQGISETMVRTATALSAGHVNVAGFNKSKPSDAAPIVADAATVRKIVEENTPGLDFVVDRQRGWGRLVSDTSSLQAGLSGIDVKEESKLFEVLQLAKESDYMEGGRDVVVGDPKKLSEKGQALIFVAQAKRLGVRVGDAVTMNIETYNGARNTMDLTVAAVAKDVGFMSNWSVFTGKETILEIYRLSPKVTGSIMVHLKDEAQSEAVMGHLREVFTNKGYRIMDHDPQPFWMKFDTVAGEDWTGQKLDLTIWKDEVSFLAWVLSAINGVSFFLVGILMIIIGIGIMNNMWIAVRERTQEIGTLRAIGMHRSRTLLMFLTEALLLGLFATTVGALSGAVIASLLDAAHLHIPVDAVQAILMSDTLHLVVVAPQVIGSIFFFTVITGISAIWPAMRAANLEPITAIHQVG
ncbi:MAG: ABC transporter permease [Deltaproteobacteria bacterium]|nr:ABC transporter permease [Deltaproteobacteria bacterium]